MKCGKQVLYMLSKVRIYSCVKAFTLNDRDELLRLSQAGIPNHSCPILQNVVNSLTNCCACISNRWKQGRATNDSAGKAILNFMRARGKQQW